MIATKTTQAICFVLALSSLPLTGCEQRNPPMGSAKGTITYKASPIASGNVVFSNPEQGVLRVAPLSADGTFQIDELQVGEYRVCIQPPEPVLPNEIDSGAGTVVAPPKPSAHSVPRQFQTSQSTPLTAEVREGAVTEASFDLSKP